MKVALTGASGLQGMSALIYLLEQEDVVEVQGKRLLQPRAGSAGGHGRRHAGARPH